MMPRLKTSDTAVNALQRAVNEAREGTATVRVERSALAALLADHYDMAGTLKREGDAA